MKRIIGITIGLVFGIALILGADWADQFQTFDARAACEALHKRIESLEGRVAEIENIDGGSLHFNGDDGDDWYKFILPIDSDEYIITIDEEYGTSTILIPCEEVAK